MTQCQQIAERLREVLLNGTWIANTNCKEQIENLDWQEAIRSINELNSIAALTFHIHYYIAGHLNVLKGGTLDIRDKFSFDLPPIESQSDWNELVKRFISDAEEYVKRTAKLDDSILETSFTDPKYGTWRRNFEAIIEHSYYHLGQISLVKKLL